MATYRTRESGSIEACIRNKALPGPIYLTFKTMEEAKPYCQQAEAMIKAGHVPSELLEFSRPKDARRDKPEQMTSTIGAAIREFITGYHVKEGDKQWLGVLASEIGGLSPGFAPRRTAVCLRISSRRYSSSPSSVNTQR